jgi:hypothetical protein
MIPPTHWQDQEFNELLGTWNGELAYRAVCAACSREFVRSQTGLAAETCSRACYKRQHRREISEARRAVRIRFGLPAALPWSNVVAELRSGPYKWSGPTVPPYLNIRSLDTNALLKDEARYSRMPDYDEGRTRFKRLSYPHPRPIRPAEISTREPVNLGEKHHMAVLTESDVLEIRRRADAGHTQRKIAADYGVTQPLIGRIVLGTAWSHVDGPTHEPNSRPRYNLKLTPQLAAVIRERFALGQSAASLACELQLGETTIRRVIRGQAKF